jgi:hypothetical protein
VSYNPHTMAYVVAHGLVLNTVVAELVALLTAEQRALLRQRLIEQSQDIGPVDEFDPERRQLQEQQFAQWVDLLSPKP